MSTETIATPEISPAIGLNIAFCEVAATERANFKDLQAADPDGAEAFADSRRNDYLNNMEEGRKSLFMGSTVGAEHAHADSLATIEGTRALRDATDAIDFEGLSPIAAAAKMREAALAADDAIFEAKHVPGIHEGWEKAAASISGIKFFRDDKGEQKAVIVGGGSNRIVRLRGNSTKGEEVLPPTLNADDTPTNAFNGSKDDPVNPLVRVIDVEPGDRYVMFDNTGLRSYDGTPVSTEEVANAADKPHHQNIEDAAKDVARISDHRDDDQPQHVGADFGDISVGVIDVQEERGDWNRLEKILRTPTRIIVGRQLKRAERVARHREQYLNNPTWKRRLMVMGDALTNLAVLGTLAYVGSKAVGAMSHGEDHVLSGVLSHSSSPSPSVPAHNPFDNLVGPHASPDATPSASGTPHVSADVAPSSSGSASAAHGSPNTSPSAAHPSPNTSTSPTTVVHPGHPGGGTNPNTVVHPGHPGGANTNTGPNTIPTGPNGTPDLSHLPNGVKLTDEQTKWLNTSHSEGAIGDYDAKPHNDGLGHEGTLWRNAMKGLHDAGYNVGDMTEGEKKAYVQHVLDLNHMSWDDALNSPDGFNPKMPTNGDMFKTMTEITAHHEGGPLLPSADSDMGRHLDSIRHTVESQMGNNNGGTRGQHDLNGNANSGAGNQGGRVPTDNGTPVPHPSADPSASASHAASAAASHSASASASASAAASASASHSYGSSSAVVATTSGAPGNHNTAQGLNTGQKIAALAGAAGLAVALGAGLDYNRRRKKASETDDDDYVEDGDRTSAAGKKSPVVPRPSAPPDPDETH